MKEYVLTLSKVTRVKDLGMTLLLRMGGGGRDKAKGSPFYSEMRQIESHESLAYFLSNEFCDLISFQALGQILSCDAFVQFLEVAGLGFPLEMHL